MSATLPLRESARADARQCGIVGTASRDCRDRRRPRRRRRAVRRGAAVRPHSVQRQASRPNVARRTRGPRPPAPGAGGCGGACSSQKEAAGCPAASQLTQRVVFSRGRRGGQPPRCGQLRRLPRHTSTPDLDGTPRSDPVRHGKGSACLRSCRTSARLVCRSVLVIRMQSSYAALVHE